MGALADLKQLTTKVESASGLITKTRLQKYLGKWNTEVNATLVGYVKQ
jgi:hypothetical protein